MTSTMRRAKTMAAVIVTTLLLAACGGGGGESGEGELSGVDITVGSKEFTEQLILGEITKQVLTDAGANVNDQTGLQGSTVAREALTSGQIDTYWEYTGTGWITHLGNTDPKDGEEEQFEAVKEADAENDIAWFARAPMNNTYALAVKEDGGPDVTKLSEVADVTANESPGLCAATEFLTRDDGLPGLEEAYGFSFDEVAEVELGLVYNSVGRECAFGEVFQTDGRIAANNLRVLEDDQGFFPKYNGAITMRSEIYDENADVYDQLFDPVAEVLTNEKMIDLNKRVDVDGQDPGDVATEFLRDNGFVE